MHNCQLLTFNYDYCMYVLVEEYFLSINSFCIISYHAYIVRLRGWHNNPNKARFETNRKLESFVDFGKTIKFVVLCKWNWALFNNPVAIQFTQVLHFFLLFIHFILKKDSSWLLGGELMGWTNCVFLKNKRINRCKRQKKLAM